MALDPVTKVENSDQRTYKHATNSLYPSTHEIPFAISLGANLHFPPARNAHIMIL